VSTQAARPQIRCAVFCRSVSFESDRSVNLMGIFDVIHAIAPPSGVGVLSRKLLAFLVVDLLDDPFGARHEIRLSFETPRGRPLPGATSVSGKSDGTSGLRLQMEVDLIDRSPMPGWYRLIIEVDGTRAGFIPLLLEIQKREQPGLGSN
jgi:hypothetical protein